MPRVSEPIKPRHAQSLWRLFDIDDAENHVVTSDHRHRRLLGARRERPRNRHAAEQRDELASCKMPAITAD
jgi:hypothetical protein